MSDCRPEQAAAADALQRRPTADGSPTLWSERFGEAFHSGLGAHAEAIGKFVAPAQLERFAPGSRLRVLDVCVGLGYNSAALLEAAEARQLQIDWIGLELDPRPLALALTDPGFRRLWQPATLTVLEQLQRQGHWRSADGRSGGAWRLGDARSQLGPVGQRWHGRCDLVLHDAFSPGHCPELWTVEFLGALASLLAPQGRLLTYCSAAAVRRALQLAGLELASIAAMDDQDDQTKQTKQNGSGGRRAWSAGTAASPSPFTDQAGGGVLRPLGAMERDHLLSRAAEPYRDPDGRADAVTIQRQRQERQRLRGGESSSAWRRRWGLAR
ncbi:MAG: hypothetical protein RLZZ423_914 [Cyanobacteriota bacterium]